MGAESKYDLTLADEPQPTPPHNSGEASDGDTASPVAQPPPGRWGVGEGGGEGEEGMKDGWREEGKEGRRGGGREGKVGGRWERGKDGGRE